MSSSQTPLKIHPCTPTDITNLTNLYLSAFTLSSPTRRQMYSSIPPSSLHIYQSTKFSKVLAQQSLNPPSSSPSSSFSSVDLATPEKKSAKEVHFLKCTTTQQQAEGDGEVEEVILALAIWIFLPEGYDEDADVRGMVEGIPEGADERLWRDFAAETGRLRAEEVGGRRRVGEGHWLLDLLCTYPLHERKGAASKLVRWPFKRADRDGMRCFVEASKAGHAMYDRCGFVDTGAEMRVQLGEYVPGWEGGVQRWWGMVREPRVGNGESSEVRVGNGVDVRVETVGGGDAAGEFIAKTVG